MQQMVASAMTQARRWIASLSYRTQGRMSPSVGQLTCLFIDRRSSFPLAAAQLMCVWPDKRMSSISTNDDGRAALELPEGAYDLVISAKGYLSMLIRGVGVLAGHKTEVMRGLIVGEGRGENEVPSTAVGGYVRDRLGHPLPNLLVQAVAQTKSIVDSAKTYAARTDNHGAYVIHGIGDGQYEIVLRAAERLLQREPLNVADVKHFVRHDISLIHA